VSEWDFGKLSAVREIVMASEEGYGYYYMGMSHTRSSIWRQLTAVPLGYYIHSCIKMRYKRKFRPTYVLGTAGAGPTPFRTSVPN
jgi:arginyl-tRNA---protein transferase